jgi:hypothetical protein
MSQNLINDLSDRVSALAADHDRAMALVHENSQATSRAEAKLREANREGRVMAEWLNAIRLEIEARGTNAHPETILHYAQEALSGREPHWLTPEYLNNARDPRAYYQERFRNAD